MIVKNLNIFDINLGLLLLSEKEVSISNIVIYSSNKSLTFLVWDEKNKSIYYFVSYFPGPIKMKIYSLKGLLGMFCSDLVRFECIPDIFDSLDEVIESIHENVDGIREQNIPGGNISILQIFNV